MMAGATTSLQPFAPQLRYRTSFYA